MVRPIPTGNSVKGSQEESGQAAGVLTAEGQICAGKYILQTGCIDGSLIISSDLPVNMNGIQARHRFSHQLPPHISGLLDRTHEMELVVSALRSRPPRSIEFYGPAGTGKTSLLSNIAYHPLAAGFRDGILYLSVAGQPVEDILQTIFNAFYECSIPVLLDEAVLLQALQAKQALILLDDADQPGQELEELIKLLSGCSIILATSERRLWAKGESIAIQGLPIEAAQALFERAIDRKLSPEEVLPFENLFSALQGFPQSLLQAAGLASHTSQSLSDLAFNLRSAAIPVQALNRLILASLSEEESRVIYVLAAVDGAPLAIRHLSHLSQSSNLRSILSELEQRGVVQTRGQSYILAGNLRADVLNTWDLTQWVKHVSAYFSEWSKSQSQAPEKLLEESILLLQIQKWSAGIGCWNDVLSLTKALDDVLIPLGCWGAWFQTLQLGLQAAQNLGERANEAWALHQLGTRALCLGNTQEARSFLIRSIRLRETCGDQAGASATRRNLDFLLSVEGKTTPTPAARLSRLQRPLLKPAAVILLTLALLASLAFFVSRSSRLFHEVVTNLPAPVGFTTQTGLSSQPGLPLPKGISYLPFLLSGIEPAPTSTPTPWWKSTTPTPLIPFVPYTPATMVLVSVQPIQARTIAPNQVVEATVTQTPTHAPTLKVTLTEPPLSVQANLTAAPIFQTGNTPASSLAGSVVVTTATPGTCLDFEDLSLYRVYMVGDTILTSVFPITITNFTRANGIVLNHGDVEVSNVAISGGSGNELIVDNATLIFGIEKPVNSISLLFGENGGDLNIEINGEYRAFNRFMDIHNEPIGGASVRVNSKAGSNQGTLDLFGTISQFGIGGIEVALDRVCMR